MPADTENQQQEPLLIKYVSGEIDGFDLGLLGESFTGFSGVLSDLCELTKINGEVQVKTTRIEHGSIDVFNLIHITIDTLPFSNPKDLLDFLLVASPELHQQARQFLMDAGHAHNSLNMYFQQYPFDAMIWTNLVSVFLTNMFGKTSQLKQRSQNHDNELEGVTPRQASKLRTMVSTGRYRKAVKPLTEGNVSEIKMVSHVGASSQVASITEQNVENYLPDDSRILPDFENGSSYELTGKVVGMQSTRGDTMRIRIYDIDPAYDLLTAVPDDGKTTADYKHYYGQEVTIQVEILRRTLYKKPDLKIKIMSPRQTELIEDDLA